MVEPANVLGFFHEVHSILWETPCSHCVSGTNLVIHTALYNILMDLWGVVQGTVLMLPHVPCHIPHLFNKFDSPLPARLLQATSGQIQALLVAP